MSKTNDFQKLKLFITGPTFITPEIKEASMMPEFGHRDKENEKRIKPIIENLKKLAGIDEKNNPKGFEVALIPGSGSNALETSIKSLVEDDEKILVISCGAFGDLYYNIAKNNGKFAKKLTFEPGKAINVDVLVETIKEFKPKVVAFTHNETSTGVMNNIVNISKIIKKTASENGDDVYILVDGISIFGGINLELENSFVDVYSGATQKSLAVDAGVGIIIFNQRAKEKATLVKNRGYVTDLLEHAKSASNFQILTTPSCSVINQLYIQLDKIVNVIGIEKRFQEHKEMRDFTLEWARNLTNNFVPFAEENFQSVTLTCLKVPEKYSMDDLKKIKENLRSKGYLMDTGYGKMNKTLASEGKNLTIRIGHMGDINLDMLKEYLEELKIEIEALN